MIGYMYILSVITPNREIFDKTVQEILNKHEHQGLQNGDINFIEKTIKYFEKLMEEWLSRTDLASSKIESAPSYFSTGLFIVCTILMIIIIASLFFLIRKMFKKERKFKTILGEVIDEETTLDSLHRKSRVYKQEGNYREAVRYDFIALLFKMNEKNLIYLDEAKTNSELISTLEENGCSYVYNFQKIVQKFNEAWYGHKIISGSEYDSWEQILTSMWNEVFNDEGSK